MVSVWEGRSYRQHSRWGNLNIKQNDTLDRFSYAKQMQTSYQTAGARTLCRMCVFTLRVLRIP